MELLVEDLVPPAGRLCVLGAGNCNDLDLAQLLEHYEQVHLVDRDRAALEFGTRQQQLATHSRIVLHGGVDVTGDGMELTSPSSRARTTANSTNSTPNETHDRHDWALPGPFEVVVSTCLLTQLLDAVRLSLGEQHTDLTESVLSVRDQHLRRLVSLTAAGGRFVLVTDIVSSATFPDLAHVPNENLAAALIRLIAAQNFFTGVNPFALLQFYHMDPATSGLVSDVRLARPWLWDFGPRVYAVCGLCARKKDTVETIRS
jgi:hypothetical protein